jgi:hypothetical protein
MWLGYLEEFPDYETQGTLLEDLRAHRNDFYSDLTSGAIPNLRRMRVSRSLKIPGLCILEQE